jgi:hypothetical protein
MVGLLVTMVSLVCPIHWPTLNGPAFCGLRAMHSLGLSLPRYQIKLQILLTPYQPLRTISVMMPSKSLSGINGGNVKGNMVN